VLWHTPTLSGLRRLRQEVGQFKRPYSKKKRRAKEKFSEGNIATCHDL
jgi:hypothetical protein